MKNGILVTGATSDIGYEFLKSFSEKDKVVVAFYYDYEERLDILENEYSLEIIRIKFNFLEPENLKEVLEEKINSRNYKNSNSKNEKRKKRKNNFYFI